MKNLFKVYLVVWIIIALIFNVVTFATYGDVGEFYKYDTMFFIRLILTDIAFSAQLYFSYYMIKTTPSTNKDDLSVLSVSAKNLGFLILIMLVAVTIVLFPVIPPWIVPASAFVLLVVNFFVITLSKKVLRNTLTDIKNFINKKIIKFAAIPSLVIVLALAILIPTVVYPNIKYNNAQKHIANGDYTAACSELYSISGFKDSAERLTQLAEKDTALSIYTANVGDTVIYGTYEQDANIDNGNEPLEWTVLDKKGNKILLITNYCIDKMTYHHTLTDITWDKSSLREWLNTKFIDITFTDAEKTRIAKTHLGNNKNPNYIAPKPGKTTTDKVFVLSYYEAKYYLNTDELINVKATATVKALGAHVNSTTGYAWWWLRTPGSANTSAMTNHFQKQFSAIGYQVNHASYTVRPCMWIEL